MNPIKLNFTKMKQLLFFSFILLFSISVYAQNESIPFNSENWQIFSGKVEEHLGRQSLSGSAMLKDVEFEDGIIEFDIAITDNGHIPE